MRLSPALPARARAVLDQLPDGAIEAATCSLRRGLAVTGTHQLRLPDARRSDARQSGEAGTRVDWTSPGEVARQLVRPLLEIDDWPGPSEPLLVGDGAVHADLIDEDHDLLARVRALLAEEGPVGAETLAARAQQWRIPVTPYRTLPGTVPTPPSTALPTARPAPTPTGARWDRQPVVVDLTSLWAGPLATSLLAGLGARVVKIDPDCRPDGFRAHPALYASLNGAKEIIDLDLRRAEHRRDFEALVATADLVVDSFSRRVMPNFGYGPDDLRRLNPAVATLSIVAFPAGTAEADWVSYGPGVHAASGLAVICDEAGRPRFRPAPVAYPDALAGLAAFAAAAEALAPSRLDRVAPARSHPEGSQVGIPHREISLAGALQPLMNRARMAGPPTGGPRG